MLASLEQPSWCIAGCMLAALMVQGHRATGGSGMQGQWHNKLELVANRCAQGGPGRACNHRAEPLTMQVPSQKLGARQRHRGEEELHESPTLHCLSCMTAHRRRCDVQREREKGVHRQRSPALR